MHAEKVKKTYDTAFCMTNARLSGGGVAWISFHKTKDVVPSLLVVEMINSCF